jgi:adenosylmethionine-8-amino-7-oxononanoate aminotransferase
LQAESARARIVALDKRRVWHPYTEMSGYREGPDPLVIVRAQGSRLYDADGHAYLDGNASWWSSTLGHAHPRLLAALRRQSETLAHTALAGITHGPAAELAEALCAVAPAGLEHVFYSDDGSTAVEVALKLCLQYWAQNGRPGRQRFVALEDAFHGETLGATAIGGVEAFRKPFEGALLECSFIPPPREPGSTPRAVDALAKILAAQAGAIAAVVVEPVLQGAAGMLPYDPAFLAAARELCDRHDVFLVFDEVFTGYGRSGPMWAAQHAGVSPDLLCTAKGFTGGLLPMGATLVTPRIFAGFLGLPARAFYYGHTFCGHPLGAAVALEVLRIFDEEKILENAKPKAARIAAAFESLRGVPGVARTRALGMVGALDLAGDAGYLARTGWRVYQEALRRGAYLRPLGNVVYVTPSLNIPDPDLEELLAILRESVEAACREARS